MHSNSIFISSRLIQRCQVNRSSRNTSTSLPRFANRFSVPIALKIGPYFSSLPYFAKQAFEAGVNGLVPI